MKTKHGFFLVVLGAAVAAAACAPKAPQAQIASSAGEPGYAAAYPERFDAENRELDAIPADARALSVNYTIVSAPAAGDLKAWAATEAAQPVATVLSFGAGKIRCNNGVLRLSSDGTRSFDLLLAATQAAHFVLDVNGVFR